MKRILATIIATITATILFGFGVGLLLAGESILIDEDPSIRELAKRIGLTVVIGAIGFVVAIINPVKWTKSYKESTRNLDEYFSRKHASHYHDANYLKKTPLTHVIGTDRTAYLTSVLFILYVIFAMTMILQSLIEWFTANPGDQNSFEVLGLIIIISLVTILMVFFFIAFTHAYLSDMKITIDLATKRMEYEIRFFKTRPPFSRQRERVSFPLSELQKAEIQEKKWTKRVKKAITFYVIAVSMKEAAGKQEIITSLNKKHENGLPLVVSKDKEWITQLLERLQTAAREK